MKLWRQPAQLLPVQVRPVGGETVVSYVFRLADANGFARPTMLLRAIGEPIANNVHAGILDHHDITLNAPALARLAALTGRSTASLGKTLPSLGTACADPPPVQHDRAADQRVQQFGHPRALPAMHRPDSRSSQHQGGPPIGSRDLPPPPPLGRHHPPAPQPG